MGYVNNAKAKRSVPMNSSSHTLGFPKILHRSTIGKLNVIKIPFNKLNDTTLSFLLKADVLSIALFTSIGFK